MHDSLHFARQFFFGKKRIQFWNHEYQSKKVFVAFQVVPFFLGQIIIWILKLPSTTAKLANKVYRDAIAAKNAFTTILNVDII